MEKKTRAATESGVLLLIIAAILVAVNALSALGGYKRIDTTKTERYTLSKGSGNLLRSMKQTMKATVYVTKGVPKLDQFVRELRDLLLEYKQSSAGKFDFEMLEAKDQKDKDKAKEAGLVEQPFVEASDTEEKAAVTQGYMGIIFEYGDTKDVIKFLDPNRTDGMEFWISNKIREIRDTGDNNKHIIGLLTGKDELKVADTNLTPSNMGKYSIQGIISQNFKFYQFQDVDLKNGDAEIDDKLDGLIVTQPGKEFTEKELRRIDQFLMKGKSLAIFASAVNVKGGDKDMQGTLNTWGLEKLLDGYGMELRKDVVLDFKHQFHVNAFTQTGVARIWFPQFLAIADDPRYTGNEQLVDPGFPAFFRIPEVVAPFVSSVVPHPEKQTGNSLKVVARTTERAVRRTEGTQDLKPIQRWAPKGAESGQFAIAVSLEGDKIKSAFPSGDKQGVEAPAESAKPARVFLFASSQFLTNPLARAGNAPDMGHMGMPPMPGDEQLERLAGPYAQQAITGTILAFKNTLDWMSGDTDLLAVSAKILSEPSLSYEARGGTFDPNESEESARKKEEDAKKARRSLQDWVSAILIIGVPLLFSLFGVIRWRLRVSSRAKVSLA